ncbi:hypothetical protein B296_00028451 [Ensete ventricosum]|uniref:Uncharacterized protein n=1 Tax=Ensete ventricosum TaxID=4639 RepID=A0A426YIQ4_ENSVE|nr:hypothetical protein B296_00028451 [Ensete ventricosum]
MRTRQETRQKLIEGIGGLSGVHRELAGGDQELSKKASGVYRKKTKRLAGRSWGIVEKLARSFSLELVKRRVGSVRIWSSSKED